MYFAKATRARKKEGEGTISYLQRFMDHIQQISDALHTKRSIVDFAGTIQEHARFSA